jgi:hypothetical protein
MSEIGSVVGTVDVPVNVVERFPAVGDEITAVTPDPALWTTRLWVTAEELDPRLEVAVSVTE